MTHRVHKVFCRWRYDSSMEHGQGPSASGLCEQNQQGLGVLRAAPGQKRPASGSSSLLGGDLTSSRNKWSILGCSWVRIWKACSMCRNICTYLKKIRQCQGPLTGIHDACRPLPHAPGRCRAHRTPPAGQGSQDPDLVSYALFPPLRVRSWEKSPVWSLPITSENSTTFL